MPQHQRGRWVTHQVEIGRWSQSGGVSHRAPGQAQTRPDPCQAGLARHRPRVAWLRGPVFRAVLNAQAEGCVSRRDLRLTTVRQGERGRGRRHVPGLRPPDHRVCNHRCTGSIRAQESAPGPQVLQRHGHPGNLVVGRGADTAATGPRSCGRPGRHSCRSAHACMRLVMSRYIRLALCRFA